MKVTIQPSILSGTILAAASKSSMQRACAAALLSKGTRLVQNPGHSNDDIAALDIIKRLGAEWEIAGEELTVKSNGVKPVVDEINCGESGLSIRMFTPLVALSEKEIRINGEGSLLTRPMDFFDEILPKLGVSVQSNNGKLPLKIKGPLQPTSIEIDGSLSSQFLTGLLMAFAAAPAKSSSNLPVSIKVRNLKSKPYIDLTLDVMRQFGLPLPENKNYEEFIFHKEAVEITPSEGVGTYTVEGDWSGGAFLLVAGVIAGSIRVRGLDLLSTQADKKIIDALMNANASIAMDGKGIQLHAGDMNAFEFDATDCPDLFPPLVALAAYCKGETKIKGVSRLAHKESNRGLTLQAEFGKMGVKIELLDDLMIVHGGQGVKGATVHSRHDHRIAMACAVAALKAEGETVIEEAQAVKKSYPDFYEHLESLGAKLSLNNKFTFHE
ncbi:MAG: 3-phosphoshikimate 1-carboxyvinyltransferase [Chitinophagaceae bacterium]|nr:3-phosphoshikimate 1-carboxyvinyltransferase [Chitinophagaceae bacterium]